MARNRAALERLSRTAALKVTLCAALILGTTGLLLRSTVWNQPPPESERFYSTLPDVDLGGLSPAKRAAVLEQLNGQRCPCACMRTVASCRNHHRTCSLSLAAAREAVAAGKR
jgi:hypothetical protein